jgi:hypothetical protein
LSLLILFFLGVAFSSHIQKHLLKDIVVFDHGFDLFINLPLNTLIFQLLRASLCYMERKMFKVKDFLASRVVHFGSRCLALLISRLQFLNLRRINFFWAENEGESIGSKNTALHDSE